MIKPCRLRIEVTNRCNAKCVYCPTLLLRKQQKRNMSLDFYKWIIDETNNYIKEVRPQGLGEPLLWDWLEYGVKYASDRGKRVVFNTNASLLTETRSIYLMRAGLNEIRFSVDEMEQEGFEKTRFGLSFNTILSNIKSFVEYKDTYGFHTKTVARITMSKRNASRISTIEGFWKKIVDRVIVVPEYPILTPKDLYAPYHNAKPVQCSRPTNDLTVKVNGDVILCCMDFFGKYKLGNLKKNPEILEIYNSLTAQRYRVSLLRGFGQPKICQICRTPIKEDC